MAEPSVPPAELLSLAYGLLLFFTGAGLVLFGLILRSGPSFEVPAFGAAILLHGIRALGDIGTVRAATGLPAEVFAYSGPICLYFVSAASYIFLDHYWGPGLWKSFRRAWQFHLVFATAAAASDLYTGTPGGWSGAAGMLVVVYRVILLVNIVTGSLQTRREDIYVLYGLATVFVCTVHDVLAGAGMLGWTFQARPIGIIAVMASLGVSIIQRTRADQHQLGTLSAQLNTAREIQQSLLPPQTSHPTNCHCAVRYLPMESVGGDLYDFVAIDRHRFGVLLADVTGHGIPAALIASMVKTAMAAQTHNAGAPGTVLREINRRLHDQLDSYLVTAVYAVVDTARGEVTVANAGHPAPLAWHRSDAAVEELAPTGAAIGMFPNEPYDETRTRLHPGDRFLLYTDGLIDAASPGHEVFAPERVRKQLVAGPDADIDRWTDDLLAAVRAWTGRPELALEDDLTVVALQMPASPGSGGPTG